MFRIFFFGQQRLKRRLFFFSYYRTAEGFAIFFFKTTEVAKGCCFLNIVEQQIGKVVLQILKHSILKRLFFF